MVSRILGKGDISTMSIKVNEILSGQSDEKKAGSLIQKYKKSFTFDDYAYQMGLVKKMGSAKSILSMIPNSQGLDTSKLENIETHLKIIEAMTEEERNSPLIVKSSSSVKLRISKKANVQMVEVNKLIKQFDLFKEKFKNMPDISGTKGFSAEEIISNPKLREFFTPKVQKLRVKPK
jgi:signal recognition particle subunit SRP54